jgi:hypothetical protein
VTTDTLNTQQLCVGPAGSQTCVTQSQLQQMLQNNGGGQQTITGPTPPAPAPTSDPDPAPSDTSDSSDTSTPPPAAPTQDTTQSTDTGN